MNLSSLGRAATQDGWRQKAADVVAPRIGASRLPLGADQVRALLGLVFLGMTVKHLLGTIRRARGGSD